MCMYLRAQEFIKISDTQIQIPGINFELLTSMGDSMMRFKIEAKSDQIRDIHTRQTMKSILKIKTLIPNRKVG